MNPARVTAIALILVAGLAVVVLVRSGGGAGSGAARPPDDPQELSARLAVNDARLRQAIGTWRAGRGSATGPVPDAVIARARYLQRAVQLLASDPALAMATIGLLPPRLGGETGELTVAARDLQRLSAGWPSEQPRTGAPRPLAELLGYYRVAQRRFEVGWNYLAAVNFVESAFGRVRSASVAGAQGPMQFEPATWRAYGQGGNVHDPHDAVLGAANYLHRSGAPASYATALYAYNPSRLYVDSVRRYAAVIGHDPDAVYFLYCWKP